MTGREVRTLPLDLAEVRIGERPGGGPRITGYAAVFDSWSQPIADGRGAAFREIIRPGAFARTLASGRDVVALRDHQIGRLLGRRSSGTLILEQDGSGLKVEIDPPDTTDGRDTLELIRRGDLRGMSFAFSVGPDGQRWGRDLKDRELLDVDVYDVTVTADPAYADTSVALRCLEAMRAAPPDGGDADAEHLERAARLARSRRRLRLLAARLELEGLS